jgi:carboxypeptidase PM20D1
LQFNAMKRIGFALLGLFVILLVILTARAIAFRSRQITAQPAAPMSFDRAAALERLSRAIQFRTISHRDPAQLPVEEFTGLHQFVQQNFPLVANQLSRETVGGQSLLYTWPGEDQTLKPMLLLAHMDVVPADERDWGHPPFSGTLADNYVWGRGAMDDKASMLAILEAVEHLLREGFRPKRTVYLAFGHDEEVGGSRGAAQIAALLRSRGTSLEFILDEGLNVLNGIVPGIAAPVALVGIAEKGYLSLRLTAQAAGGHSSVPPPDTAIAIVSRALQRLDANPFPTRLSGAAQQMLDFLGPEMSWTNRLALANLWLFDPLVRKQLAQSPLTNAAIRTTVAPTLFHAGNAENVLPAQASAVVNLRLLPGDSISGATEHVRRTINDPRVAIAPLQVQVEASAVSDVAGTAFELVQRTVRQTVPAALVAPGLLVAATDSRHYAALTPNVFRFLPITLGADDAKRYHGVDERISFEDYERSMRFYTQLIRNAQPATTSRTNS